MHHHELYIARLSLDRQRDLLAAAERVREVRSVRAGHAFHARSILAAWLVRWAHRLDPEAARAHPSQHAAA